MSFLRKKGNRLSVQTGNVLLTKPRWIMILLATTVFTGAGLLFGMEPLVGRLLLPIYGGTVQVWLVCLMFFQGMLFLGYLYAHLLSQKLGVWHLGILLLPVFNFPLGIQGDPVPGAPIITVIGALFCNAALPFMVLSTTTVVVQSWLVRSRFGSACEPYSLYAASNAGSLLALLGYPFLVEPNLGLHAQTLVWGLGYMLYVALASAIYVILKPKHVVPNHSQTAAQNRSHEAKPSPVQYGIWLLLSCFPSMFLLAMTNFISSEIGSFPMVWVIPLALYLFSFVLTFRRNGGVPRALGTLWPEVVLLGFLLYLIPSLRWITLLGNLIVLFIICVVAHGELYLRRPTACYLTNFYLTIAFGGWLGGCAVCILAPTLFAGLYDLPLTLAALALIFIMCRRELLIDFFAKAAFPLIGGRITAASLLLTCIAFGTWASFNSGEQYRFRNFYGTYRVVDSSLSEGNSSGEIRKLIHGSTVHGAQLLGGDNRNTPISYYHSGGPIAETYASFAPPRRIAVLGLGAGVAAAYARTGDLITYYELDPDNELIARTWFTYLDETQADLKVIVGDGRLSLQKAREQYDIIHVDAFAGDAIPTHLLTLEAITCYFNRITPDGFLLFHISNRYYDLRPVLKAAAIELGVYAAMNKPLSRSKLRPYEMPSQCVVLSTRVKPLEVLLARGWVMLNSQEDIKTPQPWTDDYINLLSPLNAKYGLM